ncbi:PREDICTED: F-box only protein 15 [Thamnophis sirtalis]|uniref:F-box only protein 15 n=1 Tax=Thamnophis sirtalis TaxID=35019 RepID=A0A6I9YB57_9SAUR|nr:PREDICTED: F-box only protein 15 [Thamnophis sirtalis]
MQLSKMKEICSWQFRKPNKSKSVIHFDSIPSEILLKILSYLDVASLLCIGCVSKLFYDLSNDNVIWFKIYSKSFLPKRKVWRTKSDQEKDCTSLSFPELQDAKSRCWKREYFMKKIAAQRSSVIQLLKPINTYTGLPLKTKEAIKISALRWVILLKDQNGKEHEMDQADISFNETSVTVYWYNKKWPPLDTLSTLQLFGVTPVLLGEDKVHNNNGPWQRSLVSEYKVANMTENAKMIGCDALVELYHFDQGFMLGLWKVRLFQIVEEEKKGIERISEGHEEDANTTGRLTEYWRDDIGLHERLNEEQNRHALYMQSSPFFSRRHYEAPIKAIPDDIDPEYGLHGYQLHIDLQSRGNNYICSTFRSLFCKKEYIRNGYLRLTVISYKKEAQHLPLDGNIGLFWRTDAFEGIIKNCFIMDLTLLDDSQKTFWCISVPVDMKLSVKKYTLYQFLGPCYCMNYKDSTGKVYMELIWMEETNEYLIVNLVIYLSTQKVNSRFDTNY